MELEKSGKKANGAFLKGTMILSASSIVVKVIGSLNWIILSRVLGGEGIGLYQMGFPMYLLAITVSSAGIPVAISVVTAEKLARRDYRGAKRIFHVSLFLLLASGLFFSLALFFGADWLIASRYIRDPRAYYSLIALAPAVFFVTFLASFRGYLQGWQIMTPTAVSEVVEQLLRVVTMLYFADLLLPYGLAYAAGGASMGAGVGAFGALLVLMWFYARLKKRLRQEIESQDLTAPVESVLSIIKRMAKIAMPVSLSSLMLPLGANLDLFVVPMRLEAAGFNVQEATEFFGYLTGMAVPLVNLAVIFTAAISISLVPSIAESRALFDIEAIREKVRISMRTAMIISFPCFMGLYFLAEKVAALIYNAPAAAGAIQTMSVGILFLGLHQVSTGILQGLDKAKIPLINMLIACVFKVIFSWNLTALPELGVRGAAMSTVVDFAVAAVINMVFIYRMTGYRPSVGSVARPFAASVIMGGAVCGVLAALGHLGAWSVLLAVAAAVPVYAAAIVLLGGLKQDELVSIPFVGKKLLLLCERIGIFRGEV